MSTTATAGILSETTLSLAAAGRTLPSVRGANHVNPATLTRWIMAGVRDRAGQRVRLEAVRCGWGWVTSREALERFVARLTPTPADAPPPCRTPTQRQRAVDRANRELAAAGI